MDERFRYITHKGDSIAMKDLSNLQDDMEIVRLLRMRSTLQTRHGLLVDLTNTHFTRIIMKQAKENANSVRPLLKRFSVVGTGSMVGVLICAVSRFCVISIATFETRGAPTDWMAKELLRG